MLSFVNQDVQTSSDHGLLHHHAHQAIRDRGRWLLIDYGSAIQARYDPLV